MGGAAALQHVSAAEIVRMCGEPHMRLSEADAIALCAPAPTAAQLEAFRRGWRPGSRAGLVALFTWAVDFHRGPYDGCGEAIRQRIIAYLAAQVWTEGKGSSAVVEFGLEEDGLDHVALLDLMAAFARSRVVMSRADLRFLDALPESFTVWRGGAKSEGPALRCGYSWTTDKAVAHAFARGCERLGGGGGRVIWRRVRKGDVIAAFADRAEAEVVLRPSRYALRRRFRGER